jgi:hypothetical protein
MKPDPIKSLLDSAAEDQRQLEFWLGVRMGEIVCELEDAGVELERIPKVLEDYAAWMRDNMREFQE